MGNVIIIDNLPKYVKENANALDRALNRMSIDIERLSKSQVPLLKGQLRASGYHTRRGIMSYSVGYNKVYAAYQEFGGDGRRTIKHYSKAGTGKGYLKDPGDTISKQAFQYFTSEVRNILL